MRRACYILSVFLFVGCATSGKQSEKTDVMIDLDLVSSSVTVFKPGVKDWCVPDATCDYLGDIKCDQPSEDLCVRQLQKDAVKLGGDSVVLQLLKPYPGQKGFVLSYAQAYNCKNKYTELGKRYQSVKSVRVTKIKYQDKEYLKQCGMAQNCKKLEPFECNNKKSNPVPRCQQILAKRYPEWGLARILVIEEEKFVALFDRGMYQGGNYVLKGFAYQCDRD